MAENKQAIKGLSIDDIQYGIIAKEWEGSDTKIDKLPINIKPSELDDTTYPFTRTVVLIDVNISVECVVHTMIFTQTTKKQVAYSCVDNRIWTRFHFDLWSKWVVIPTQLKTINKVNILGSGNIPLKTINGEDIVGTGDFELMKKNPVYIENHSLDSNKIPFTCVENIKINGVNYFCFVHTLIYNNVSRQIAYDQNSEKIWTRFNAGGGWETEWVEIPNSGNFKTINGLDLIGKGNISFKSINNETMVGEGNIPLKTINKQHISGIGNFELMDRNPTNISTVELNSTKIPFVCSYINECECVVHTMVYSDHSRRQVAYSCFDNKIWTRTFVDEWVNNGAWIEIPNKFKTINGESIIGDGNINISSSSSTPNATVISNYFVYDGSTTPISVDNDLKDGDRIWIYFVNEKMSAGKLSLKFKYPNDKTKICAIYLNGQCGGSNDYCKHGPVFGAGRYEFMYIEGQLHFTGSNITNKEPYIIVDEIENKEIIYELTPNTHTVFNNKTTPLIQITSGDNCSFEFKSSESLKFVYPDVWKWGTTNKPPIKFFGKNIYYVKVVNNLATISTFAV